MRSESRGDVILGFRVCVVWRRGRRRLRERKEVNEPARRRAGPSPRGLAPGAVRCMRARPGRLRISVSQAFQLRPEPLPEIGEGLPDYHGDAAAGDDDPGGGAQDTLTEAA